MQIKYWIAYCTVKDFYITIFYGCSDYREFRARHLGRDFSE